MSAPTDQEMAELCRLAEEATPGPWNANQSPDRHHTDTVDAFYLSGGRDTIAMVGRSELEQQNADSGYIAAANPNRIIALLDAYEARGRAIERLRADEAAPIIADLLTSVLQGAGYRRDDIVRVLRGGGYEHLLIWEREAVDWLWEYLRANPDHPPINLRAAEFVKAARRADETKGGA